MAQGVKRQNLGFFNDAEIGQCKVAGNAKNLSGTMFFERVQELFGEVREVISGCGVMSLEAP